MNWLWQSGAAFQIVSKCMKNSVVLYFPATYWAENAENEQAECET